VFSIAGATFYFVWLGASAAASSQASASSSAPANIRLMASLVAAQDPTGLWVVHRSTATKMY